MRAGLFQGHRAYWSPAMDFVGMEAFEERFVQCQMDWSLVRNFGFLIRKFSHLDALRLLGGRPYGGGPSPDGRFFLIPHHLVGRYVVFPLATIANRLIVKT